MYFCKKIFLTILVAGLTLWSNAMKLKLKETRWTTEITADWQNTIPDSAKLIPAVMGKYIDLQKLDKAAKEHLVYMVLLAPEDGTVAFGFGADWWFEAFINGKPVLSSMQTGNGTSCYATWNHLAALQVKKGENLLAVRVKSGSAGGGLIAGESDITLGVAPAVLTKRTTPFITPERSGSSYRLIVLGDTHFDAPYETYHSKYNEPDARLNRIQRAEFARNEAMWRTRGPSLLKAASTHVNANTKAVVQLGDLVQGDCGDPTVHSRMLLDTLEAFRKTFNSLPLLTVTGNHDIRGTGAQDAYEKVIPQYHSRILNRQVDKTTFYFTMGEDLFLFIDFSAPALDVVQEAFRKHADARYKFVLTHGPVIPSKSSSPRWCFLGNTEYVRHFFRDLFLKNDVMVLTGHVHRMEITECVTDQGRITQLMANSVWENEKLAKPEVSCTAPEEYGKDVSEKYEDFFGEYKNAVTRFWRAQGAGYFVMDVTPECIKVNAYGGDSLKPFAVWEFKK